MSEVHAPLANLPVRFEQASVVIGGVRLLDRIDLTLDAGPPTVLIGPNGAGKTTLLKLGMGLLQPSSGRITWGGSIVGQPGRRAFMFQHPTMLRRSAAANIRYALAASGHPRRQRGTRTAELLDLVGLAGLGERPARRLSGGERQRLALARALARDPSVLFLDEPTASLDPAATRAFEQVIGEIAGRGIKIVMATHDLGEARRLAGDIVLLHCGRIVEWAAASTFFDSPRSDEAQRFIAGDLLV